MLGSLKKLLMKRDYEKLSEELDEMILLGEDTDLDDIIDVNLTEGKQYTDGDFKDIPEDDPDLGNDDLDALLDEEEKNSQEDEEPSMDESKCSPTVEEASSCKKDKGMCESMEDILMDVDYSYLEESFYTDEGKDPSGNKKVEDPIQKESEEEIMMDDDDEVDAMMEEEEDIEGLAESFDFLFLSEEEEMESDLKLDTTDDSESKASKPQVDESSEELTPEKVDDMDVEDLAESLDYLEFMEL